MPNKSFGNPVGWDDLVQLVDGWYIGGYLANAEGTYSYNYDGSAVKGTSIDFIQNFAYIDNGKLQKGVIARVGKGFKCNKPSQDCELSENNTNPGGTTQFARDDGKGIAFPSNQNLIAPANQAGYLISSNNPISANNNTSKPAQARISNEVYYAALRKSLGYSNKDDTDVLASIPAGSTVQILSGPKTADGLNWWQVSWNGISGWIADHTGSGKTIMIFLP
jgi:hypothetical protein